MGETTKIQWCDHTFNPWRGCTKVAPGCSACYAERQSKRNPSVLGIWGPNGTRVVAAEKAWAEPLKWNKAAGEAGVRRRVFCASLADVFEDWQGPIHHSDGSELWRCKDQEPNRWVRWPANGVTDFLPHELANYNAGMFRQLSMDDIRARLFALIDATPNLDWLLVTKRPENVRRMWPVTPFRAEFGDYRPNVWLLASVSDQPSACAMIPELLLARRLVPVLGVSETELWIERYAELLGCDPRPGAVAAAIESLKAERDAAARSIPGHRRAAEDALIRSMRRTAVNCGQSSSCAVSHWCKTSDEKAAEAAAKGGA